MKLSKMASIDVPPEYPPYQATYMDGDVNFCCRENDPAEAVKGMIRMINLWQKWVGAQGSKSSLTPTGKQQKQIVGKCPECGKDVEFRKGVNKAGKPYQGNFCTKCDYVKWIN